MDEKQLNENYDNGTTKIQNKQQILWESYTQDTKILFVDMCAEWTA